MAVPEDRYVKVGDINTRYWMSGDKGSNVILVHGLGGSVENWLNNIDVLAQNHRVYALDLRGFGRTDKTPVLEKIDELIQFLYDFMEVMQIDKASLIGNSLGGGLVLAFSVSFKDKVEKLVLVDNAGMGPEVIFAFKILSLPVIGELFYQPTLKAIAWLWRQIVFDPLLVTGELVEKTHSLAVLPGAKKAMLATVRAGINILGQSDYVTRLLLESAPKVEVPTLIFWGERDRIIPVAHASIAAGLIPHAQLKIFDNCGHMAQFERPDDFNNLVQEFLAK